MNKNTLIQRNPLFAGLTAGETADAVRRMNGREETYERGNVIFPAGEKNTHAGIILSGGVNLEMSDIWGGRTSIGHSGPGDIFGEAYACCTEERMLVDAVASEETEVLLIDIGPIVNATGTADLLSQQLVRNLLKLTSMKCIELSKRMNYTKPRTIRLRVLAYLSEQAMKNKSRDFVVPFNRQELADYLGLDRSSLSSELTEMSRDGLIICHKNHFKLLGDRVDYLPTQPPTRRKKTKPDTDENTEDTAPGASPWTRLS